MSLRDTFIGSSNLSGHVADTGQTWQVSAQAGSGGEITTFTNGVVSLSATSVGITDSELWLDSGLTDLQFTCQATRKVNSTFDLYLQFRLSSLGASDYQNNTTDLDFTNIDANTVAVSTTNYHNGQSESATTSVNPAWAVGDTKTILARLSGNQVWVYLNNALVLSRTTTSLPTNGAGKTRFALQGSFTIAAPNYLYATITGPLQITALPAATASQSTAQGGTGTSGQTSTITVYAADSNGIRLPNGGSLVSTILTGCNAGASVTTADNGDGTYSIKYRPTSACTDTLGITLDGTTIGNSPLTITNNPGPRNPSNTSVIGHPTSGQTSTVTVTCRDAFGNAVSCSGSTTTLTFRNHSWQTTVLAPSGATPAVPVVPTGFGPVLVTPTTDGVPGPATLLDIAAANFAPYAGPWRGDRFSKVSPMPPLSSGTAVNFVYRVDDKAPNLVDDQLPIQVQDRMSLV